MVIAAKSQPPTPPGRGGGNQLRLNLPYNLTHDNIITDNLFFSCVSERPVVSNELGVISHKTAKDCWNTLFLSLIDIFYIVGFF